jgi:hypothetical protein
LPCLGLNTKALFTIDHTLIYHLEMDFRLKYFIPDQVGYTNAKQMFEGILSVIHKTYNSHVDSFQPEQMRDFIDVFIQQMKTDNEVKSSSSVFHFLCQKFISLFFFTKETLFKLLWNKGRGKSVFYNDKSVCRGLRDYLQHPQLGFVLFV